MPERVPYCSWHGRQPCQGGGGGAAATAVRRRDLAAFFTPRPYYGGGAKVKASPIKRSITLVGDDLSSVAGSSWLHRPRHRGPLVAPKDEIEEEIILPPAAEFEDSHSSVQLVGGDFFGVRLGRSSLRTINRKKTPNKDKANVSLLSGSKG